MAHPYNRFFATAVTLFSLASAFAAPSALKTINTPQGGQIVYGQVDGAASEAAATGAVLRTVHRSAEHTPELPSLRPLGRRRHGGHRVRVHGALPFFNTRQGDGMLHGQVDGRATEDGGMGAVLRTVH